MSEPLEQVAVLAAIYKSRLFLTMPYAQTPNVRVEIFEGPRTITIPTTPYRVKRTDEGLVVASIVNLELPPGERFIMVFTQIRSRLPSEGLSIAEERIDRAIAALSLELSPLVFADRVYRGWVASRSGINHQAWLINHDALSPAWEPLLDALKASEATIVDDDTNRRFSLLARWFARALIEDPNEERFLFLWTMLEVFPMKDTSDIRPLQHFLATRVGRDPAEVKEALQLGKLNGMRCDLVHDRSLRLADRDRTGVLKLLERICSEVLRHLLGKPYSGSLDGYFASGAPAA